MSEMYRVVKIGGKIGILDIDIEATKSSLLLLGIRKWDIMTLEPRYMKLYKMFGMGAIIVTKTK